MINKKNHGHRINNKASRTYKSWDHMIQRCNNPNNTRYKDWGGAGIRVCDEWLIFENFLRDMGERPEGTSIDRFPVDAKIYSKETCRWATPRQQSHNTRSFKKSTSKYKGVSWDKRTSKWRADIKINNKRKNLGRFTTEKEAAIVYNKAAIKAWGSDAYINKI